MGLDTSHDCWHGAYSAFNRWRCKVAEVAGMPPLMLMEGFYCKAGDGQHGITTFYDAGNEMVKRCHEDLEKSLPIRWASLRPDPLHALLHHSDCEGYLNWGNAYKMAERLEAVAALMPDEDAGGHIGNWRDKTLQFAKGLRLAHSLKERIKFA